MTREKIEKEHTIRFENFPLSNGLYLITKTIGTGKFNRDLQLPRAFSSKRFDSLSQKYLA
jgi:hypothetical protein